MSETGIGQFLVALIVPFMTAYALGYFIRKSIKFIAGIFGFFFIVIGIMWYSGVLPCLSPVHNWVTHSQSNTSRSTWDCFSTGTRKLGDTNVDIDRLSEPLRSRFMELHLDEYTFEEFMEITRRLVMKKHHLERVIAEKIGYLVWNKMQSKDVRDVLRVAKLAKSLSDVDWLVDVQMKYGRKKEDY